MGVKRKLCCLFKKTTEILNTAKEKKKKTRLIQFVERGKHANPKSTLSAASQALQSVFPLYNINLP